MTGASHDSCKSISGAKVRDFFGIGKVNLSYRLGTFPEKTFFGFAQGIFIYDPSDDFG